MRIPLTNRKREKIYAIVDKEDFELLSKVKWQLHMPRKAHYTYYALRTVTVKGKRSCQWMHREVLRLRDPKAKVDHIDGNGLNNRRKNLRVASISQNGLNSRLRMDNKSGYKGVWKPKGASGWIAGIGQNYKSIHIGTFPTKEEAALAYNKKAKELFGEYARMNDIRYLKERNNHD